MVMLGKGEWYGDAWVIAQGSSVLYWAGISAAKQMAASRSE